MPRRACALVIAAVVSWLAAAASAGPVSADGVVTDTGGWIPWEHPAEPAVAGSALDMSFLLDAPAGRISRP